MKIIHQHGEVHVTPLSQAADLINYHDSRAREYMNSSVEHAINAGREITNMLIERADAGVHTDLYDDEFADCFSREEFNILIKLANNHQRARARLKKIHPADFSLAKLVEVMK